MNEDYDSLQEKWLLPGQKQNNAVYSSSNFKVLSEHEKKRKKQARKPINFSRAIYLY